MVKLTTGHHISLSKSRRQQKASKQLTIALVGNANVGKSILFNQLTGSNQIIGNWPGKTVERAEGWLRFGDYDITIIDLPGIYSFSTFSIEELISREYIISGKPDVVINVVDASVLERNLFFTIQLLEMEIPLIICLNQMDMAKKKGMIINVKKLEEVLGVPVIPTVATRGEGVYELIEKAIEVVEHKIEKKKNVIKYGIEVETRIDKLSKMIESKNLGLPYPPRWVAIKLLEDDPEIREIVSSKSKEIVNSAEILAEEISRIHGEPCFSVIISERYSIVNRIVRDAVVQRKAEMTFSEKLDWITTHRVMGYLISGGILAGLILWTFTVGDTLSSLLSDALSFLEPVDPRISGPIISIIWNGAFGGFVAGVTLVIPFVIPFYLLMAVFEDSGILTRVAFMMDSFMHKIGLHGKAIIPLILGYGCNVPAIYTSRIMETGRERLLTALAITFIPCAARTIIILGMVAVFLGIEWALALYLIDLIIIFVVGRIAMKILPGKSTGLIMEMHALRLPSLKVVFKQTIARTKSIIYLVFPIYIIGSIFVQVLYSHGLLEPVNHALSFITVNWLGLPLITGILLIFGLIRKELILLMLVAIYGAEDLILYLTPVQLIVLALVSMIYLPCSSVFASLVKEFGWKNAILTSLANISMAILLGGLASRILPFIIS
ncbi:MAG: ferrous iron transport protein B [Aigarchaeota archaeon]|nr:ferrous iron transport protein B [Aigarchaeota archaeon]MDW7986250.1 ferrous iron transport protein B [Nitrososphaerota archaeon]